MRRTFVITTTTAGVLALSGLAVAVPALADTDGTGAASSSAVDRVRDALSGLVSDGSLSEEQADEVASTLGEAGLGGRGDHGGRPGLAAAATALGTTEEELRTALAADGATLATVAADRGVDRDTLVTALTEAARERIATAVEDGRLSQQEADQRLAELGERIEALVDRTGPGSHGPGPGSGPGDDADD
ncbi:hypothetical protein [Geodermatophilus sp. SYSU D00079]